MVMHFRWFAIFSIFLLAPAL